MISHHSIHSITTLFSFLRPARATPVAPAATLSRHDWQRMVAEMLD